MRLYFVTEARFFRKGDSYYTEGSFTSTLWKRYLSIFSDIVVVARVKDISEDIAINSNLRSDMDNVAFLPIPYYIGAKGFLSKKRSIIELMREHFQDTYAYILRVPGLVGHCASKVLREKKIGYGVEVVGDPHDVFTIGRNPLNLLIRDYNIRILKKIVKNADASIYVTREKLQRRYPPRKQTFSTYASNVIIKEEQIEDVPRDTEITIPHIVTLGMLSQMYKAPDVVIDALRILKERGINCSVTWVGDGKYREPMVQYAIDKGVSEMIDFIGLVPAGEAVRKILYSHNIFILVSRTEGLPRALIEAMATGMFCIATRVGGIPELLNDRWLIDPDDSKQLADAVEKAINNPGFVKEQIKENLLTVRDYSENILSVRRNSFYQELIRMSK